LSERKLRHAEMMTCDMRSAIERHFKIRDQQKTADLKTALTEQFRQALPDADDAEIARHVAECMARMEEAL
jgi:hypothetical protein